MKNVILTVLVSLSALPASAADRSGFECEKGSFLARDGETILCKGFCLAHVIDECATGAVRCPKGTESFRIEHQKTPGGPFVSQTIRTRGQERKVAEDQMFAALGETRFEPACPYSPHFVRYTGLYPIAADQWDETLYSPAGPRFSQPNLEPLRIGESRESRCAFGSHAVLNSRSGFDCVSECSLQVQTSERDAADGRGYTPVYYTYTSISVTSSVREARIIGFGGYRRVLRSVEVMGEPKGDDLKLRTDQMKSDLASLCSTFSP